MLASLINNSFMVSSLGTRPASAAPSVGRAWSPQMSQTRMESFIAKVSECGDFLRGSCAMLNFYVCQESGCSAWQFGLLEGSKTTQ